MSQAPHILPFEKLLTELRLSGFAIGVDSYLRINQLLNHWQQEPERAVSELRLQLGALLARDEKEQALFYQRFDAFVERYAFTPPAELEHATAKKWFPLALGIVAAFLILWVGFYGYRESQKEIRPGWEYLQERHSYRVHLHDTSATRHIPLLLEDSIVSRTWWQGDSLMGEEAYLLYEAQAPGEYPVRLILSSESGLSDTLEKTIRILAPLRLNVGRADTSLKQVRYTLSLVKPIRTANLSRGIQARVQKADSLFWQTHEAETRYQVQWGETETASGIWEAADSSLTLQKKFAEYGGKAITFHARQTWRDKSTGQIRATYQTNVKRSLQLEKPKVVQLEKIPIAEFDLEPEDISDLVKQPQPEFWDLWPIWLSVLVLLFYGLYELWLRQTRQVGLDSSDLGGPLHQELRIDRPQVRLFGSEDFETAALQLRARRLGEGEEIDVPQSLFRTIDQGGIPELVWRKLKQSSQYLFLIEQKSHEDQQAAYFADLVRELQQRDISAEAWFYQGDPSLCWQQRHDPQSERELSRLAADYGAYRLIVVGSGEGFLEEFAGLQLSESVSLFSAWPVRAWLSTRATEAWDYREQLMAPLMPVLPANVQGLKELVTQWQSEETISPLRWARNAPDISAPEDEDLDELRAYLGSQGFQWLCACAVYPELYWELSLYYGQVLQLLDEQGQPMSPETEQVLLRLLRLHAFRKGKLSRSLRLQLYQVLDPELARQVRAYIIALLAQPHNQAPEGSYARQQQQSTLAIYQYLNSEQQAEDIAQLKEDLKEVPPHRIKDVVSLHSVQEIKSNPLLIRLPKSFYRGEIPIYGTKWQARLGLLVGLLLIFWGGYWSQTDNPLGKAPYQAPYELHELSLKSAEDSARWELYQSYRAFEEGSLSQALAHAEAAFVLDPARKKVKAYRSMLRFNQAVQRYRAATLAREYRRAGIDFEGCCLDTLLRDAHYASGLAMLYADEDSIALQALLKARATYYQDSTSLYGALASHTQTVFSNQLITTYATAAPAVQDSIAVLRSWIGDGLGMCFIRGGSFMMGDDKSGKPDEKPAHEVTVSSFYMGKTEVTFEEYDAFCEARGRDKPEDKGWGRGRRPVINVSWYDAVEYCNWRSMLDSLQPVYRINGKKIEWRSMSNGYRLPTEAEWEYAARGGNPSQGFDYAGSNDPGAVAWYSANSNRQSHPVAQKQANELGLYDMSGNLREWCWDWYDSDYYTNSPSTDPKGPTTGSYRVLRGGSWNYNPQYLRVSCRGGSGSRYFYYGFRLSRSL